MKLFFVLFFVLFSSQVFSQAIVYSLYSPKEILVELFEAEGFQKDKKVVVLSAKEDQIIAIGKITEMELKEFPGKVKVAIEEVVDNLLILEGDGVELLDYKLFKEKNIPGFTSLTIAGDKKIPSEYKDLAYFGVFTSDGHNLDAGEFLISPFQMQYGLDDKWGLKVVNALWLDGYANIGAKRQVFKNRFAKLTLNGLGAFKIQEQDWIAQLGGVITLPVNSKFQQHLMFNGTFDPQYDNAKATKDLHLFRDSDIRSITEYMTGRWNRVLYGPVYNVELQTFGGTISHMWIWSSFHTSLGIATRDITNLTFDSKGYYYVYDLFWRF